MTMTVVDINDMADWQTELQRINFRSSSSLVWRTISSLRNSLYFRVQIEKDNCPVLIVPARTVDLNWHVHVLTYCCHVTKITYFSELYSLKPIGPIDSFPFKLLWASHWHSRLQLCYRILLFNYVCFVASAYCLINHNCKWQSDEASKSLRVVNSLNVIHIMKFVRNFYTSNYCAYLVMLWIMECHKNLVHIRQVCATWAIVFSISELLSTSNQHAICTKAHSLQFYERTLA